MKNESHEVRSAVRMLRELGQMAEEATLTGSLQGGQARAVARYNEVVSWLKEAKLLPPFGHAALPADSSYSDLAVEARLTASSLREQGGGEPNQGSDLGVLTRLAPFVDPGDLRELIREATRDGAKINPDLLSQLAPFLDRGSMSELLRDHFRQVPPSPPAPPPAPVAPDWTNFAGETSETLPIESEPSILETREQQVLGLAGRLADPTLSHHERANILKEINRIGSRG